MAEYVTPSSSLASLRASSSITIADSSGVAGSVDTTFGPNCVRMSGSTGIDFIETMPFIGGAAPTTIYFHFDFWAPWGDYVNNVLWQWMNSAGVAVLRVIVNYVGGSQFQYWNGSAWTSLAAGFSYTQGVRYACDVKIICGVSGSYEIKFGGAVIASGSGMHAAVTNITSMRLYNPYTAGTTYAYYSQIAAADFSLQDYRGQFAVLNALGSYYTGGTGLITDITDSSDATQWAFTAAGGRGATTTALTAIGTYIVYGAFINGRVRVSGGTLTDAKFGFRSAGADNLSGFLSLNGNLEPRGAVIKAFGGAAVTVANFNAAEKFVLAS